MMSTINPRSPYVYVIPGDYGVRDPEGNMLPGKLEYLGPHDEIQKIRNEPRNPQRAFLTTMRTSLAGYIVNANTVGAVAVDLILAFEWGFYRSLGPMEEGVLEPSGFDHKASACLYCKQVNPNSPFVPRFYPSAVGHKDDCLVRRVVEVACR